MKLNTLVNKYKNRKYVCQHVFPELTAVCPTTKLPDFYTVEITYEPNEKLIELKSLKLYFGSYRNIGILHEEITNKILDDFIEAVEPRWVRIEVKVNVRGGIYTSIRRHWSKEKGDEVEKIIKSNNRN